MQTLATTAARANRVVLFTHGWLTNLVGSNAFFAPIIAGLGARLDDDTVLVCLHWPSKDVLGEFSYFEMEKRAALIGATAAKSILQAAITAAGPKVSVEVVGHSFGAIVACAALAGIADASYAGYSFGLTLLQGALPNDALENGQPFGPIQKLYPRVKITTSRLDRAIGYWFPFAETVECRHDCRAMGCWGPTDATQAIYKDRLTTYAIEDWQRQAGLQNDLWGGEHSNIAIPQVFDLISQG